MLLNDCLNAIIDDGIEGVRFDYSKPSDTLKREGSIEGFEACRGKEPEEIKALLIDAGERRAKAMRENDPRYWFYRCRELEIDWTLNVLSNIMLWQGWPTMGMMTLRGAIKAREILGMSVDDP